MPCTALYSVQTGQPPPSPPPHLSGALQGALVSTRQRKQARDGRDPGQDAQPPEAQTACSWDPPPWRPRPGPRGESGCGSRLSHRHPCSLVGSPTLKEEAAGGWRRSTELVVY